MCNWILVCKWHFSQDLCWFWFFFFPLLMSSLKTSLLLLLLMRSSNLELCFAIHCAIPNVKRTCFLHNEWLCTFHLKIEVLVGLAYSETLFCLFVFSGKSSSWRVNPIERILFFFFNYLRKWWDIILCSMQLTFLLSFKTGSCLETGLLTVTDS